MCVFLLLECLLQAVQKTFFHKRPENCTVYYNILESKMHIFCQKFQVDKGGISCTKEMYIENL